MLFHRRVRTMDHGNVRFNGEKSKALWHILVQRRRVALDLSNLGHEIFILHESLRGSVCGEFRPTIGTKIVTEWVRT